MSYVHFQNFMNFMTDFNLLCFWHALHIKQNDSRVRVRGLLMRLILE